MKSSAFLCDIDCLLDTRLAILFKLDHNKIIPVLKDYFSRASDMFKGYENLNFDEAYSKRNLADLKQAFITLHHRLIYEFIYCTLSMPKTNPELMEPKLIINTYPYVLSEEDDYALIKKIINITDGKCEITLINKDIKDLTPEFLKSLEVTIYSIYDFTLWLETMSVLNILRKQTCPEITMLSPAINRKENIHINKLKVKDIPLIEAIELSVRPFIDLKLIPVNLYSSDFNIFKNIHKSISS